MYITFYKTFRGHSEDYQLTFEDFLNGIEFTPQTTAIETTIAPFTVERDKENLRRFYERHKKASWKELPRLPYFPSSECPRHYSTFHIPKKTGGLGKKNGQENRALTNVWYDISPIVPWSSERVNHPTQKPIQLMERCVDIWTNKGDLVLDFTMGSGSTGVACLNLNRKFIGIELDENYFNIAKQRIEECEESLHKM